MLHFQDELKIKYLRLQFTLQAAESGALPTHKVSAIRGGIGEMLLRINCIGNRNCEECEFIDECVVQRTIYSRFDRKPDYVTSGDSVGYVLECDNRKTTFREGDKLRFNLILFGKTIAYFGQYIQAIFSLGAFGIGKDSVTFQIASIRNEDGDELLSANGVNKEKLIVGNIADYVEKRMTEIGDTDIIHLKFSSPTTIKYEGEFIQHFQASAVLEAVRRRVVIMNYFVNGPIDRIEKYKIPEIGEATEESKTVIVPRYSTRKHQRINLQGIIGNLKMQNVPEELLELLLACEVLHIGKNTSFGFGKYRVEN